MDVDGSSGWGDDSPSEAATADEKERARELLRPSQGEGPPLPEGWEEKVDPGSGRKYYVNHRTRVKQWERPAAPAARQTTDWVRHFVGARVRNLTGI